ncbi:MAG: glycosyltransferase family 4 protein [Patescibacteria group bacterium]|jgi:glycosyltransferase involved in cell wall biosynthesis
MKILFVHQGLQTFVKKDLDILQGAHEVRSIEWKSDLAEIADNLFHLWKGVTWCDLTFSWFGKLHAFFAVLFSKILRKKSIVVAGGDDVAHVPEIGYGMFSFWWKRWCPKFVFRHADLIVTVSEFNKTETLVNTQADSKKTKMIYHGFSGDIFKNAASSKENIVITIGSVSNETIVKKGLRLFVESAKLLPDIKFLLVGPDKDGTLGRLKETAPPNVELLGGVYGQDLVELCGRAKVYVQASIHESFGCSLAEAMLCRCIPVVSKNSAIPEVVGEAGIYVDELTAGNVAEKVKYALTLSEDNGLRARKRILENFPLTRRKRQLLEVVRILGND